MKTYAELLMEIVGDDLREECEFMDILAGYRGFTIANDHDDGFLRWFNGDFETAKNYMIDANTKIMKRLMSRDDWNESFWDTEVGQFLSEAQWEIFRGERLTAKEAAAILFSGPEWEYADDNLRNVQLIKLRRKGLVPVYRKPNRELPMKVQKRRDEPPDFQRSSDGTLIGAFYYYRGDLKPVKRQKKYVKPNRVY